MFINKIGECINFAFQDLLYIEYITSIIHTGALTLKVMIWLPENCKNKYIK